MIPWNSGNTSLRNARSFYQKCAPVMIVMPFNKLAAGGECRQCGLGSVACRRRRYWPRRTIYGPAAAAPGPERRAHNPAAARPNPIGTNHPATPALTLTKQAVHLLLPSPPSPPNSTALVHVVKYLRGDAGFSHPLRPLPLATYHL